MADQDYVIGAPGPAPGATPMTCAGCGATVYLSSEGRAFATAGAKPLCLPCGMAQAVRDDEPIIPI